MCVGVLSTEEVVQQTVACGAVDIMVNAMKACDYDGEVCADAMRGLLHIAGMCVCVCVCE